MIQRNVSVIVRRTPTMVSKRPAVVHVENNDIWANMHEKKLVKQELQAEVSRERLPLEYLCILCRTLFDNPSIALCCGRSACSRCFARHTEESCPLCGKPWTEDTRPVPNPRLAATVESLDLRYFIMPGCKEEPEAEAVPAEDTRADAAPVATVGIKEPAPLP